MSIYILVFLPFLGGGEGEKGRVVSGRKGFFLGNLNA